MTGTEHVQSGQATWLGRIVREPLAQFMAAAALLFALHSLLNGVPARGPTDVVVVSEGRIRQLSEGFRLLSQRPPTAEEIEMLVEDFVAEEIAYREALALGLDADDTVVRRRMRQKLDFLMEDMEALAEPADADLAAFIEANRAMFILPERRAITQVLASADQRGGDAARTAQAWLQRLRAGGDPEGFGDVSMLPAVTPLTTQSGLSTQFGRTFADTVFSAEAGEWLGPVASPFGAHLVRIDAIEAERLPALDEVRARARTDWIEARRRELRRTRETSLRERYRVEVQWPGDRPGADAS